MNPKTFLLLNVVLGFYNVGTIWAHEVDIFRSWKLVGTARFHEVQRVHWRKIPYWVLMPVGLAFCGSVALLWYHPAGSPRWGIWGVFLCQALSLILTAIFWGPWQARLAHDPLGPDSAYLSKILRTHWVRTFLINAAAAVLLAWAILLT